jgi:hypothetical protein
MTERMAVLNTKITKDTKGSRLLGDPGIPGVPKFAAAARVIV